MALDATNETGKDEDCFCDYSVLYFIAEKSASRSILFYAEIWTVARLHSH